MMGQYKAAFIIPVHAERILNEEGWIFSTVARVPTEVLSALIQGLGLEIKEEYEDVSVFVGKGLKASVLRDSAGEIEQIYLQLYDRSGDEISAMLRSNGFDNVELFTP